MTEAEASIPLFKGSLYTVQERMATFENSSWPFDTGSCTPKKMAEAGFYYCGSYATPDWVRCVVCHHNLDGWEEDDVPWSEHARHVPTCPFINTVKDPYTITVGDVLQLEKKAAELFIKKEVSKLREDAQSYFEGLVEKLRKLADELPEED